MEKISLRKNQLMQQRSHILPCGLYNGKMQIDCRLNEIQMFKGKSEGKETEWYHLIIIKQYNQIINKIKMNSGNRSMVFDITKNKKNIKRVQH